MGRIIMYKSIYMRLLLMVVVAISLLYTFNVLINILASRDIKEKTLETAISKLDYYISNMEHDISNLMSSQKRLFNNRELISLSQGKYETSIYQRKLVIDDLQAKLREICDASRLIEDIYVYVPALNRRISPLTIAELTHEDRVQMGKMTDEQTISYPFMEINGGLYVNLVSINTEHSTYDDTIPLFLISIKFSKSILEGELAQIAGNGESVAMLVGPDFYLTSRTQLEDDLDIKVSEIVNSSKSEDSIEYSEQLQLNGKEYVMIYKRPKMLNIVFANYMPEEYFFYSVNIYGMWLLAVTLMTIVIISVVSYKLHSMIARPLNDLLEAFEKTHSGSFDMRVEYNKKDEFYHVYQGFNQMMLKIRQLIESVYEQKIYIQSAQLKQLQYGINPHFLYNSMFIIYRMSKSGDCENITKLSSYLSKYYQYITKSPLDFVKLTEEIAYTKHYIDIQMFRFSERMSYSFEPTPENCGNILVPKLIVQPVVENAFVHGLEKKAADGKLIVGQRVENGFIVISVEDNGKPLDDDKIREIEARLDDQSIDVSGLINVHRRLKIKYGDECGIRISRGEMNGFKVTLKIPLKEK